MTQLIENIRKKTQNKKGRSNRVDAKPKEVTPKEEPLEFDVERVREISVLIDTESGSLTGDINGIDTPEAAAEAIAEILH